jgi:predicted deacylase
MKPDDLSRFPILGARKRGEVQRHEFGLPGVALKEDRWTAVSVTGSEPGPAVLINAGIHGAEYPAVQTAIELSTELDPAQVRGTVIFVPLINLHAFWERSMFVSPVDGKNPNRMFPGDPEGSYSQQLAWAMTTELIDHADAHVDLHGGDMVEALVPFAICQRADSDASRKALEYAKVYGLPYVLAVDRPVQQAEGNMTCAAAVERGVPSIIAEAGGVGQLERESVELLKTGARRLLHHIGVLAEGPEPAPEPTLLSSFEWLYSPAAGMFYTNVQVGDEVQEGDIVGTVGSLYGETLAEVRSPVDGPVLFLTSSPAMKHGGLLMGIGVR